jgi:hypothetical protein
VTSLHILSITYDLTPPARGVCGHVMCDSARVMPVGWDRGWHILGKPKRRAHAAHDAAVQGIRQLAGDAATNGLPAVPIHASQLPYLDCQGAPAASLAAAAGLHADRQSASTSGPPWNPASGASLRGVSARQTDPGGQARARLSYPGSPAPALGQQRVEESPCSNIFSLQLEDSEQSLQRASPGSRGAQPPHLQRHSTQPADEVAPDLIDWLTIEAGATMQHDVRLLDEHPRVGFAEAELFELKLGEGDVIDGLLLSVKPVPVLDDGAEIQRHNVLYRRLLCP